MSATGDERSIRIELAADELELVRTALRLLLQSERDADLVAAIKRLLERLDASSGTPAI